LATEKTTASATTITTKLKSSLRLGEYYQISSTDYATTASTSTTTSTTITLRSFLWAI